MSAIFSAAVILAGFNLIFSPSVKVAVSAVLCLTGVPRMLATDSAISKSEYGFFKFKEGLI